MPFRIAIVAQQFAPSFGGLERWTVGFARFLAARGHDLHVVAFGGEPEPGILLHQARLAVTEIGQARALEAALASLPDCVVYDTGLCRVGHVLQPQTGSRLLSLDRDIATHSSPRRVKAALSPRTQSRRLMLRMIEQAQLRRARAFIAVSDQVRRLLIARGAVPDRIRIVRNGTDPIRFAAGRLAPLRLAERRRLGVAEDQILFFGLAHNLRLKGAANSLKALAMVRQAGHDGHLLLAGQQPEPDLLSLTDRLGLAPHVTFAGYVSDVERLYAAADIFVHPTRWDACSVSTLEAMASTLPVITTRFDGAADLVRSGETGIVLPDPADVTALATAMSTLSDPSHRAAFRTALSHAPPPLAQDFEAIEAVLADVAGRMGLA